MESTQNEFQAEMNSELDAENRIANETPAETWSKITELMETILIQSKELEENARKLKEDAFNIFPKF